MERVIQIGVVGVLLGWASLGVAQQKRPTIQNRFAEKADSMYLHASTTTQIRNDFYDSIGVGADVGYYLNESLGVEARWSYLFSKLSPGASKVKAQTGLTPDARPQHMLMTLGARYSVGYGKMLVGRGSVVHFDPQFVVHGGVALAEKRVLPTATVAVSLLTHYQYNIQAKLDLGIALQAEKRARGWVPSIGFMPTLGIGWGGGFGELAALFSGGSGGTSQ